MSQTGIISRRSAIKLLTCGGTMLYFDMASPLRAESYTTPGSLPPAFSPIDRTLPDVAEKRYFGDNPDRAHGILWNKAGYLADKKLPAPSEKVPLVIVGGGISGLLSAYLLREFKPVVLEQAPRFGGNSQGQVWRDIPYAIGAAYIVKPDEGSDIESLLRELGIDRDWKIKEESGPVVINDKLYRNFWEGETNGDKSQFQKLFKYFSDIYEENGYEFPEIPLVAGSNAENVKKLDRISFLSHLQQTAGAPLLPEIETVIEHYCWSSFGASAADISAAAGLNFYVSELGPLAVLPGGNAAIAERVLERLYKSLPSQNFRTSSLVFDIKVTEEGALVSYGDQNGNVKTIQAAAVVMAAPKFVAAKLIDGLEEERLSAIRKLRYHSYLVANLMLEDEVSESFYDLFLLGEGKTDRSSLRTASMAQGITDVILATYARPVKGRTVLTFYRGIPYDGSRADIFLPDSFQRYYREFESQIYDRILPLLKLSEKKAIDLRITRWGHPLPVAAPGLIADGVTDIIRKPFRNRVFFIEQDNWALPAFETAASEALNWHATIARLLRAT